MSRHTDGERCLLRDCTRWHTTGTAELVGGVWHWPIGTQWDVPFAGKRVSPTVKPSPATKYVPEAAEPPFTKQAGPDAPPRASALNEARDLITGDRNNQYGPPTQDFARTADLLNALGYARVDAEGSVQEILPSDVALIIAQVKVSRLMHSRDKRDSWVDLAGYAACGYECAVEEAENA